jgi:hypothetical protein
MSIMRLYSFGDFEEEEEVLFRMGAQATRFIEITKPAQMCSVVAW